ncbi:MAG: glycosyltransferase family 4 protein [Acidimicrobiales bacterium]
MRVGVNLTWLRPGVVGGSEVYLTRLLRGMLELSPDDIELVLFVLPDFARVYPDLVAVFETHVAPVSGSRRPLRVAVESTWLPWRAKRAHLDMLHHAGGTVPVVRLTPGIVTIHDVQYLDLPDNFSRVKLRYLQLMVPLAVRAGKLVMTPSDYSRDRVVQAFKVDPRRTYVVHHGIEALPRAGGRPDFGGDFIFFPAMTHPHKNHGLLLNVLDQIEDIHLVLTGSKGDADSGLTEEISRKSLGSRVHHLGHVSSETLGALYSDALALVFPSHYEGFGAPPIEAMLAGCPVVASYSTALPEVVGSGGLLLDPDNPVEWVHAIQRLRGESVYRSELIAAGYAQAERFSSIEAARSQLLAYRRAVSLLDESST